MGKEGGGDITIAQEKKGGILRKNTEKRTCKGESEWGSSAVEGARQGGRFCRRHSFASRDDQGKRTGEKEEGHAGVGNVLRKGGRTPEPKPGPYGLGSPSLTANGKTKKKKAIGFLGEESSGECDNID